MASIDAVKEARAVLVRASRIHALNDGDPKKDEDVSWLLESLANEVERLRRGESICQCCHLRKDAEFERGDF